MKLWNKVREIYYELFGYPGEMVDLVAASSILKLVAMGISNEEISKTLDMRMDSVESEIIRWFNSEIFPDFSGWNYTLKVNPLAVVQKVGNFSDYSKLVYPSKIPSEDITKLSYEVAFQFMKKRKEIEVKWL